MTIIGFRSRATLFRGVPGLAVSLLAICAEQALQGSPEVLTNLSQLRSGPFTNLPSRLMLATRLEGAVLAGGAAGSVALFDGGSIPFTLLTRVSTPRLERGQRIVVTGNCLVDDTSLILRGALLVENDGTHLMLERAPGAYLPAGKYPIWLQYFNKQGERSPIISVSGPERPRQPIPDALLSHPEGVTFAEFAPNIRASRARRLGAGIMPEAVRVNWGQLSDGSLDTQYFEVQGVVSATEESTIWLLTRGGRVKVQLPEIAASTLRQCEGALVRVRGCLIPGRDDQTQQVKLGGFALRPAPRIVVRLEAAEAGFVGLNVADNGIGIPQESLTRILAQGFSTRKDGDGFGLHSSVLAAQDMGGELTAQSDGAGKAATFTLTLPLAVRKPTPETRLRKAPLKTVS